MKPLTLRVYIPAGALPKLLRPRRSMKVAAVENADIALKELARDLSVLIGGKPLPAEQFEATYEGITLDPTDLITYLQFEIQATVPNPKDYLQDQYLIEFVTIEVQSPDGSVAVRRAVLKDQFLQESTPPLSLTPSTTAEWALQAMDQIAKSKNVDIEINSDAIQLITLPILNTMTSSSDVDPWIEAALQNFEQNFKKSANPGQPLTREQLIQFTMPHTTTGGGGGGGGSSVTAPKATITEVTPTHGPGSQLILIKGTNFAEGAAVTIGGVPAENVIVEAGGTLIQAIVPLSIGSTGPKDVTVTNPGAAAATLTGVFTVDPYVIETVNLDNSPSDVGVLPSMDKLFVACKATDEILVINTATNTVSTSIPVVADSKPVALAVDPLYKRFYYVTEQDKKVRVINGETHSLIDERGLGVVPMAITVDPASGHGYVSSYLDNAVRPFTSLVEMQNPYYVNRAVDVAYRPTDQQAYVLSQQDKRVYVLDASLQNPLAAIDVGDKPAAIVYNPGNDRIYVTNEADNTVTVINAETNTKVGTITVGYAPQGIVAHPQTNRLYVANSLDGTISVIDGNSGANGGAGEVIGTPIMVGGTPKRLALDTVHNRLYVTLATGNAIAVIVP